MPTLTDADVERFKTDGYALVKRPVLPPDDFAALLRIFDEHVAANDGAPFTELDMPHVHDERLLDLLLSDAVLDLVAPLTGPDIVVWSSGFISKDPLTGAPTPWHADAAYWEGRLDDYRGIATVWLAIDRSSPANGCLRVIPGTHLGGDREYDVVDPDAFFAKEARDIDESLAVDFELDPNECSIHDGRIVHGAKANTSPHRRAAYTMRYLPATTRILDTEHVTWLARGSALAGNAHANA